MKKQRKSLVHRILLLFLACAMAVVPTGCSIFGSGLSVYPDGWVVELRDEDADASGLEPEEEQVEIAEPAATADILYADFSLSCGNFRGLDQLYSDILLAEAGRDLKIYTVDYNEATESKRLVEIDTTRLLSLQYSYGAAPLDLLEDSELEVNSEGVNIFVTDLISNVSSSRLGRIIAQSGSSGVSLYVFDLPFEDSTSFSAYTTADKKETISVANISGNKEILMMVYGDIEAVMDFDRTFYTEQRFHFCHVSLEGDDSPRGNEAQLDFQPLFWSGDAPTGITYTNSNYSFGLMDWDLDAVFTQANTVTVKKTRAATSSNPNAIRLNLYALPVENMRNPSAEIISVQTFTSGAWEESSTVIAAPEVTPVVDGLPSGNGDSEEAADITAAHGYLIPEGQFACLLTLEEPGLPAGLYAVEVAVHYETETIQEAQLSLSEFAQLYGATLNEYIVALQEDCSEIGGSKTKYCYQGSGTKNVFLRLLGLSGITAELQAAGYKTGGDGTNIVTRTVVLRLLIDYR